MHKDRLGQVIYVGKAVSLKNRVRQYFQASYRNSSRKMKTLVSRIAEFEYIRCGSEMEALILECNLIKKYMPKFNVLLRDDKTYPYIVVTTSEPFPRVLKTRILKKDGNRYFGPYSDVGAVNHIVDLFNSMFSLKRCAASSFSGGHRPCLNYHIEACRGICRGSVSEQDYRRSIDKIIQFLSGKDKPLIDDLRKKMMEASDALEFERAAKYRDDIAALKALEEKQRVTMVSDKDLDIVMAVKSGDQSFVVLFPVRDGKLSGRENFSIQADEEDSRKDIVSGFIKQYYSQWAVVPPEILVEEELDDKELLEQFLSGDRHKVRITVPKKGPKKRLLELTGNDITEMTRTLSEKAETKKEQEDAVYREMMDVLGAGGFERSADRKDERIRVESFDISNTNGVDSVGAMVVFDGLDPVRKDYRRFKIRTVEGPDDYASLQEVLYRRFRRAAKGDPGFIRMPDIIMMDGGLGQVSAAYKVIDAMKLSVPVVGLAKDSGHRTRAIVFRDGTEIDLRDRPVLFRYAGTIQEEVHRFAIDYHRNVRGKRQIRSALDDIEGIGPKRRNELLYYFKNIEAIRGASVGELMKVPSITEKNARAIREYFDKGLLK